MERLQSLSMFSYTKSSLTLRQNNNSQLNTRAYKNLQIGAVGF